MNDLDQYKTVAKAIEQAFATVPYPGDNNIAYYQDYYPSDDWDCAEVFRGKHWREILPERLRECPTSCLTLEAFHFYLPAYLLGKLKHSKKTDFAGDAIIYSLEPPEDSLALWIRKIEQLSTSQKAAVRMFLEAMAIGGRRIHKDAQRALDKYWSKF
jgi:hypothetical protein